MGLPKYSSLEEIVSDSAPNVWALLIETYKGFLPVINGEGKLLRFYKQNNPLGTGILVSLVLSVFTLVLAEVTGNYSQVDRLWSILPALYICHYTAYAHLNGIKSDRLDTIAIIAIIWSIRLTFNYWRKGGYSWASEDYRWEIIKKYIGRPAFFIFNLTFISFLQNFLLLVITTPAYLLLIVANSIPQEKGENSKLDLIFSRAQMLAILLEFFADQQQWNYHKAKDEYKKTGKPVPGADLSELERGFLSSGLWAFSRHPNFAGEQLVWVLLYQWSAFATDSIYNWTGIGAILYCLLFQGSTWLTELLTSAKYKDYKTYQKNVNMFLPGIASIREGGFIFPTESNAKVQ